MVGGFIGHWSSGAAASIGGGAHLHVVCVVAPALPCLSHCCHAVREPCSARGAVSPFLMEGETTFALLFYFKNNTHTGVVVGGANIL
eukprot:scaffold496_cov119-Isochrysis_galbana.AAC.6